MGKVILVILGFLLFMGLFPSCDFLDKKRSEIAEESIVSPSKQAETKGCTHYERRW